MADEAEAGHDEISRVDSVVARAVALAYHGDSAAARAAADAAVEATAEMGGLKAGAAYRALAMAAGPLAMPRRRNTRPMRPGYP